VPFTDLFGQFKLVCLKPLQDIYSIKYFEFIGATE